MVSDVGVIFITDGGLHSTLNSFITSSPRWLIASPQCGSSSVPGPACDSIRAVQGCGVGSSSSCELTGNGFHGMTVEYGFWYFI